MSSFICSDLHILTIACHVHARPFTTYQTKSLFTHEQLDIAADIYLLNEAAYNHRYAEASSTDRESLLKRFKALLTPPRPSLIQMIKHVDCFLYQCNESEDLVNDPIYRMLEGRRSDMIIKALGDEYENAAWGL